MMDTALIAAARALAVVKAGASPAETRRTLEGELVVRATYAAGLGVSAEQLVTELLDWLAANPSTLGHRDAYLEANASLRLCRTLGVPAPESVPRVVKAALAALAEATGLPELRLMELLHHPTANRYRQLREELLSGSSAAVLEAIVERLDHHPLEILAANRRNEEAGR